MSNPQETELRIRDYRQYASWQIVHLLRSLKVINDLTPLQQKMVEAKSDLIATTMREDIAKAQEHLLDELEAKSGETVDHTMGKPIKVKFVSLETMEAKRKELKAQPEGDTL